MGLIENIGIISQSPRVPLKQVTQVAAALQKQVIRDFAPVWSLNATIDAFDDLDDLPLGYWPVVIKDHIGYDAAGIHLDNDGQPFALVSSADDIDGWSLTASHEVLEMLADPGGNRLVAGDSPKPGQGRVMFLVEVCDPSEHASFGYSVNGILVSDFYTPQYFDPVANASVRLSYTGAIQRPRQVLEGGYLSWTDPQTNIWWQETWFDGKKSAFRSLGKLTNANGSIRSQIDRLSQRHTLDAIGSGRGVATMAGIRGSGVERATSARGAALQAQIDSISRAGAEKAASPAKKRTGVAAKPK